MSRTASAQPAATRRTTSAASALHTSTARHSALREQTSGEPAGVRLRETTERIHMIEQAAILEERSRLARDLHDSAAQTLVSLTMIAEGCRSLAASGNLPDPDRHFARISVIATDALRELRVLIHQLYPEALDALGLLGALQQRFTTVEERFGITARLSASPTLTLAPHVEEQLYWIILEALNNAVKHARAGMVQVAISQEAGGAVRATIRDDGCGFVPEQTRAGCGFRTMRERSALIGGVLSIAAVPGAGTVVTVAFGGAEGAP